MSLKKHFTSEVSDALKRQAKTGILSLQDVAHLPSIVQKYIAYTGCLDKEKIWNVSVVFEGEMKLDEKQDWISIHSEQYNFFDSPSRFLSKDGKTFESLPWSIPIGEYREIDGRKIPTYGEAIWHYPDHQYCYGRFRVKEVRYNVNAII